MPETKPTLRECIEAEREAWKTLDLAGGRAGAWELAVTALDNARAATDQAVGRVEAVLSVLTPELVEALQNLHDAAASPWCAGESCQVLALIRTLRELATGGASDE